MSSHEKLKVFCRELISENQELKNLLLDCPDEPEFDDFTKWEIILNHFGIDYEIENDVLKRYNENYIKCSEIKITSKDRNNFKLIFKDGIYIFNEIL